jgi:hypothetical protein
MSALKMSNVLGIQGLVIVSTLDHTVWVMVRCEPLRDIHPSSWREDADPRDALWRPDLRNSASGITHGPTRRNGPRCNRSGSACIPCRERFTRRPAISQCGGL